MRVMDAEPKYAWTTERDVVFMWDDGSDYMAILIDNFNEHQWDHLDMIVMDSYVLEMRVILKLHENISHTVK